jgi:hypothetical protein
MADKKISQLTALAQGDVTVSTDVLPIVDTSATETKKVTAAALVGAGLAAGVTSVDINSGSIDGTTIGANSAAAGTFTNLTASGTVSFSGATVSNGGSVTTVDINGGTIDGATIATSDITVGSGKTLNVSAGTLTLADDQISGDKVEGGTINAITINTLTSTAVNATTVDATNVEVTNVKAKDGTAAATIADSTGVVSITANPILSGGTANGVLYLNGSKVATSGSALTFDGSALEVSTAGTARLNLISSSTAAGARPFLFMSNTGIVGRSGRLLGDTSNNLLLASRTTSAVIGDIVFSLGDSYTEAMRLNSTGLGIGTSSPGQRLAVRSADNTGTTIVGRFESNNGNQAVGIRFNGVRGLGGALSLGTDAAASITFEPNNTERMVLDSSGNLGLGVTPSAWSSDFGPVIQVKTGSGGGALTGSATDNFRMFSNTFYDGAYKRIGAGFATQYEQAVGRHIWSTAGTSTANSSITFT